MDVVYGPPNFVEAMNVDHQVDRAAPAGLALAASAGPAPALPAGTTCFRRRARKQHVRTAEEAAVMRRVMHQRALAVENKLKKQQERDRKHVAWQQAVAARDLQKEAEDAAKVRSGRRKALAGKQAAKEQRAQATAAIRAVAKAETAAARKTCIGTLPPRKAEQQGGASSPCLDRVPQVSTQRCSSGASESGSGRHNRRQKKPAAPATPPKQAARAQPSSSSSQMTAVEADVIYCHCCFRTSSSAWRFGRLHPFAGQKLCNQCRIWESRHGCLLNSNKVGEFKEAFLAQQAQRCQAAGEVPAPYMEGEQAPGLQATGEVPALDLEVEQAQEAAERQGSAVQAMETDDGHATGSAESALAALQAAQASLQAARQKGKQLQRHNEQSVGRPQQLQQAPLEGGDEGSGTEAGPKARRKRSADDNLVQRAAKKRAGMDSGATGGATDAAMVKGEGGSAADAGTSGGVVVTAMDSGGYAFQQRRMLKMRKV
ncbi:hypothetical protein ABBQ38_013453 [Trebouxia sp. C0009 RCD-2024]